MTALARAKLNLTLEIEGVRPDGLHLLNSLATSISLADRVTLTPRDDTTSTLEVLGENTGPDTLNLALKAATLYRDSFGGPGFDILLDKAIPVGAGLGGGSADAAAVLVLARHINAARVSDDELGAIGAELGADVPFCVRGGLARMRGVGEEIESILPPPEFSAATIVLAVPDFWMPTAEVYVAYDRAPRRGSSDPLPPPVAGMAVRFANDLEPAAEALVPAMRKLRRHMSEVLASPVRMTGSGSAMFGFAASAEAAVAAVAKLRQKFRDAWACTTASEGVEIVG